MKPLHHAMAMLLVVCFLSIATACGRDPFEPLIKCEDCTQYKAKIESLEIDNKMLQQQVDLYKLEKAHRLKDYQQDVERLREELEAEKAACEHRMPDGTASVLPSNDKNRKIPDPTEVRNQLKAANERAKKCGSKGALVVSFLVTPEGKVNDIKAVSGSFVGSPTEKCILSVLKNSRFTPFTGTPIPVKYTFKL